MRDELKKADLQSAINLSSKAHFHEKAKVFAGELFLTKWSQPLASIEEHYARRALLEVAYREQDYQAAFEQLVLMPAEELGGEVMVAKLAGPLWTAGYRKEFHAVLEKLKTRRDADLSTLERLSGLYRNIEERWSIEEVMTLAALRL